MSILAVVQSQLLQTLFKELDLASLGDGSEVDARVLATTSDGKATLSIGGKQITANFQNTGGLALSLLPGDLIGLRVDLSQGEPRLILTERNGAAGQTPRQASATVVSTTDPGSARLGAAIETDAPQTRPLAEILKYLEPEVAAKAEAILSAPNPRAVLLQSAITAVLGQGGRGAVLADIEALLQPPAAGARAAARAGSESEPQPRLLPAPLFEALATVFARQLDGRRTPEVADLRQALRQSGLFFEAKLARGELPTPATDAKAALLVLRRAIGRFLESTSDGEDPAEADAADLKAASAGPDGTSRAAAREIAPPRRDALPQPDRAGSSVVTDDLDTRSALQVTAGHLDQAIERLKLQQFASLPPLPENPLASRTAPHDLPVWLFDVPLRLNQQTSIAGFRIEKDREARRGNVEQVWRIEFAVDTAELGAVQGSIALRGSAIAVALTAERAETAQAFRDGAASLREALDTSSLEITDLSILTGVPQKKPLAPGYFVDSAA